MERQCRLCFETDETSPFLSPCNCRGTQAYIHTHCLALYMQHYPDAVCRVCRIRMKPFYDVDLMYGLATLTWIFTLAYASSLPTEPRGMYLMLSAGFILYCFVLRQLPIWFGVMGMFVSSLFLYLTVETLFWILACMAGLLTTIILWMYIPVSFLMVGTAILMSAFYSAMLILFAISRTDRTLAGMLLCGIMFVWYMAIRARPPQRIV